MPSIKDLTLTYHALNEEGTFSEGDTITGNVTLVLEKQIKIESFFVKAKGDAKVHWSERRGDRNYSYSANSRYFKLKQFLIPEASSETSVPEGVHVYNFSLQIPQGRMPSSFRGHYGKIVYMLEVKMIRSWKLDRTVEKEFNFISRMTENLHHLQSRQVGSKEKELGIFSSGRVTMDAIVDKMLYAPGESVTVFLRINNSSSKDMTPKFSILKNVEYRARGSRKCESQVICKVAGVSISPDTNKDVKCALKIPADQTPSIQYCDIISVEYYLKVYLDISFSFDPELKFPLIISRAGWFAPHQHGNTVGPYQGGGMVGPSNNDFPLPAAGFYDSGAYGYSGNQAYSTQPPTYQSAPAFPPGPAGMYPPQPAQMGGFYSTPVPQQPSPFSSPSSSTMFHPPPPAGAFYPSPTAPPTLNPFPDASTANLLPSAPASDRSPSAHPVFNLSPGAPTYSLSPSAPVMNTDFLSQSEEPPPSYSSLYPPSTTETSDRK
ncbi:arrestin domain-containing protein 3-like [Thalassophryne amazonica]|uniref:arrestin domain-containing protein 3-like n=1 Tax=Thalassophryne amazonica TaxID=390379 RepID=UPI001470A613|nr:arrestin domain-containing protein 3-like [Thalassophryne amazonica]